MLDVVTPSFPRNSVTHDNSWAPPGKGINVVILLVNVARTLNVRIRAHHEPDQAVGRRAGSAATIVDNWARKPMRDSSRSKAGNFTLRLLHLLSTGTSVADDLVLLVVMYSIPRSRYYGVIHSLVGTPRDLACVRPERQQPRDGRFQENASKYDLQPSKGNSPDSLQ